MKTAKMFLSMFFVILSQVVFSQSIPTYKYQFAPSYNDWDNAGLLTNNDNNNCGPATNAMVIKWFLGVDLSTALNSSPSSAQSQYNCRTQARWNYCSVNLEDGYSNAYYNYTDSQDLITVLEYLGLQTETFTGSSNVTLSNIEDAIDNKKLVICHVDVNYYYPSNHATSHWVLVYGYDSNYIKIHDPGYYSKEAFNCPKDDFLDALTYANGGGEMIMISVINSSDVVGHYSDGFHTNGTSQAFEDCFDLYTPTIGCPNSNSGGGVFVHEYYGPDYTTSNYWVWAQDFEQDDLTQSHYGDDGKSIIILNDYESPVKSYLVKEGIYGYYKTNNGPYNYGVPYTNEITQSYANGPDTQTGDFAQPNDVLTVQKFKRRYSSSGTLIDYNQRKTIVYNARTETTSYFAVGEFEIKGYDGSQWYVIVDSNPANDIPWPKSGETSPTGKWFTKPGNYNFTRHDGNGNRVTDGSGFTVIITEGNSQFADPAPMHDITFITSPTGGTIWQNGSQVTNPSSFKEGYSYEMVAKLSGYDDKTFNFTVGTSDDTVYVDFTNSNYISITSPDGGNYTVNSTLGIQYDYSLTQSNIKIELSRNAGSTWEVIDSSTTANGSYNWTVSGTESSQCKIKLTYLADTDIFDISEMFTIGDASSTSFPLTLEAEDMDGPVEYFSDAVRLLRPNGWFLYDHIDVSQKGLVQFDLVVLADSVVNSTWPQVTIAGCSQGNVNVDSTSYQSKYFTRYYSSALTNSSVEIRLYGSDGSAIVVDKVTASYIPCAELVVSATELNMGADTSGVVSSTFSISNSGNDTLSGSLSIDSPFYLSSSSISVASSGNTQYTVSINLDTLSLGTYSDTIFVNTTYETEQIIVSVAKSENVSSTDFYFSDTFNRTSLGPNWSVTTEGSATASIFGNNYLSLNASSGRVYTLLNTPGSNLTEAVVSFWLDNGGASRANNNTNVYIGYVDENNYRYVSISEDNYESSRQKVEIKKMVDGQASVLTSSSNGFSLANGVYQFSLVGDTLRFKNIENGTSINLMAVDDSLTFAGKVGFSANEETSYIDDFEVSGSDSTEQDVTRSMTVSVDSLNFDADTDTLSFVLKNTGNISNNWVVSEIPATSWMTISSDTSGLLTTGDSLQLSLIVDRQSLADTTYYSSLVVISDADTSTIYVSMVKYTPPAQAIFGNWSRRAELTIDNTKVSGSSDLTDFPVLLTEDCLPSDIFTYAKSDGGDIRFSSDTSGTAELAREITYFSSPSAEIWVKVPTLSYNTDTKIYVWYGNSSASDHHADSTYGAKNVWHSNFKAVWHMQETSSTRYGSTSNDNDLSDNNTVTNANGKITKGADFEENNTEYLSISNSNQTGLNFGTGAFTLGGWFKKETGTHSDGMLIWKRNSGGGDAGYQFFFGGSSTNYDVWIYCGNGSNAEFTTTDTHTFNNTNWNHIFVTRDASGKILFVVNGVEEDPNKTITYNLDNSYDFKLGEQVPSSTYDGMMDEIRLLNTDLSSDWLATEYANQNSPSTFVSAGTSVALSKAVPSEEAVMEGFVPEKFELFQNYPNPFNPETTIKYHLPKEQQVKLTIYNMLGKKVKVLVDEIQPAGAYNVIWKSTNENAVGSGVYFYQIKTAEFKKVKKMLFVK